MGPTISFKRSASSSEENKKDTVQLCSSIVKMDGLGKKFRVQQAQLKVAEKRAVELFVLSEFVTSNLTSLHPQPK